MTYEKYQQALLLQAQMDEIVELQGLFANAHGEHGNRCLAAIDVLRTDPTHIIVEECKVHNHIRVPKDIQEKIDKILRDEYSRLQEEFAKL